VLQDLAFVAAAVMLARSVGPVRAAQFGLRPTALWRRAIVVVPLALVGFFAVSAVWSAIVEVNGQEHELIKDIGGYGGTLEVLAACVVTCVVGPICEEILFRGFMFRSLANWRRPWQAALITGVLFGGTHALSAPAVDLVPLAVFGVLLCGIYQWSGSIYPCIALHILNNAVTLGISEHWAWRTIELIFGALLAAALVLWLVRLASARWQPTPATD
jgi:uncharacterized protein